MPALATKVGGRRGAPEVVNRRAIQVPGHEVQHPPPVGPVGLLAQGPSVTLGYIKRNINNAEHLSLEACFDAEAMHHSRSGETADHKEAAIAFVEKRKPVFSGH